MQVSRSEERELFLKYLSNIYLLNPSLPISYDTIYHELTKFVIYEGEQAVIGNDSLLAVQLGLNNRFRGNSRVHTFSSNGGYFWAIENRMGKDDKKFLSDMHNSIKLYVSADLDNIYRVAEQLFNFMINEGIVMQCKVSKDMRNDALVCRVRTSEDVLKISKYLDSLSYSANVRPNPFLYDNGKVSVAKDGTLSYNSTLSKLLNGYLNLKRATRSLDKVSCQDFNNFINNQINMLKSNQKVYFMHLYKLSGEDSYRDFIMICNLISKNLNDSLSLEWIFKYAVSDLDDNKYNYSKHDEDKVLYVINSLANYYSIEYVHQVIMKFIETGNLNLFTRRNDIRAVVSENFSGEAIKAIVSNLGWNAFISASKATYEKYGEEWLYNAIDKYLKNEGISGFTRDGDARSRLGLIIPPELLRSIIQAKLLERGYDFNTYSLTNLILEELSKIEKKKFDGRN